MLPFADLSDDSTRDYLVDGLTEDLINALGRFSELTVMSWNAVLPYRGKPANPGAVSRALAVRYQVEGSVRRSGDQVRVDARLIDASGQVLWSARLDRPAADAVFLAGQDRRRNRRELCDPGEPGRAAAGLSQPTEKSRSLRSGVARPAGLATPRSGNIAAARTLLRRAVELDPNLAAAYTGLAESWYITVLMG